MAPQRIKERHGTGNGYITDGCRCDLCRQWGRESRAARKADPAKQAAHMASQAKYRASEQGKEKARENKRKRIEKIRTLIREAKDCPCTDCGVSYPYYVMDLDHRPGEGKAMNLATWTRDGGGIPALVEEIAKCDPVCANCHRERTHQRR